MKKELLETMQCLNCRASSLELQIFNEDLREVREGGVYCKNCQVRCAISGGVLNMLPAVLSPEIIHEKEHAEEFDYIDTEEGRYPINQETLKKFKNLFLSLPAGDGSKVFLPGGSFDNQAGNAERFFKTLGMLRLTGSERVLEVGASFTWGAWRFAQKGCRVVALDITEYLHAADLYMEHDGAYYDRVMADMSQLPFKDGSFDLVFSHSVVHHCKDLKKLFSEFCRVLKPGGRLVALHECSFGLLEDKSGKALKEAIDEGFNENAYTVPQWTKGIRDGGFRHVRCHFFSVIDDYLYRKKLRKAPRTFEIALAEWIRQEPLVHGILNALSVWPRIIFRPKSWMFIATK